MARLLNVADAGNTPRFSRLARVALVLEGDGTAGRRPLSILAFTYRLWARRHASHINNVMNQWTPDGLSGARAGISAADVAGLVAHTVCLASSEHIDARCIMSLDLGKCFDRYHLSNLRAMAQYLGIDALVHAVDLNCHLERHLFADGEPAEFVLSGKGILGVPQGCTLSCCHCNLTVALWHSRWQDRCASAELKSYLDDRLVATRSWEDLNEVLSATMDLNTMLGPKLNTSKSMRGVAGTNAAVRRLGTARDQLRQLPLVNSFTYLGVDIVLRGANRPAVSKRRTLHAARCQAVRCLPRCQRGAATVDCNSPL